jgi:hypothetical protein
MYGFHQAQLLSNMAIGIFTLRQQLRGLLSTNWPGAKTPYVEYLVVGGGGGAGTGNGGGGGGAGGVLTGLFPVTAGTSYPVTVGGGGATATNGVNSVLGSVIAVGGGKAANILPGSDGGSGGGGSTQGGLNNAGGSGIFNQGNSGGSSYSASPYGSGGGGGAGTIGLTGRDNSGNGGAGIASAISGTVRTYGGGGGGGSTSQGAAAGLGGVGGGGYNTGPGDVNTGGGGGGASGAGGSGIVIISYPDIYPALTTATGATPSTSGSGSISFNGSSLLTSAATQVIPSTADFTIEAWVYLTSFTGNPVIAGQGSAGDAGRSLFYVSTSGTLSFSTGSSIVISASSNLSLSTWTYVAITKASNVGTFYINGTSAGGGSINNAIQNTTLTIGGSNPAWTVQYFNGNISNFRLSNIARTITSTPTAPFSSIANTILLLNTVSGAPFADAANSPNTFTLTGSPAWNQLSPFATGLGYKNRVYTWTSGSGAFEV